MFCSGFTKARLVNVPWIDTSAGKPQFENVYATSYSNGPKTSGASAAAGAASASAATATVMV